MKKNELQAVRPHQMAFVELESALKTIARFYKNQTDLHWTRERIKERVDKIFDEVDKRK